MYAEAIDEMLMQYHNGLLRLFPAIPKAWESGCSFNGFMLDMNTGVSASIASDTVECEIYSADAKSILIEVFGRVSSLELNAGTNSFKFTRTPGGV